MITFTRISCLILGSALLWSGASLQASTVLFAELSGRVEPAPQIPAVFGNREYAVDIKIDGAKAQSGALSAELFQVSGDLAVSLGAVVPLQNGFVLSGIASQPAHVSIQFPEVKRRAEILIRLSLTPQSSTVPISLGEVRFVVFPSSITKELADLLSPGADGVIRVVLFGEGRKLHQFLSQIHVPFADAGIAVPDRFETKRLYLGEAIKENSFQVTQEMSAAHTVIFTPDASLPPGVYLDQKFPGTLIRVTLPLLDNLQDDPRAQLALIKIIHLLT